MKSPRGAGRSGARSLARLAAVPAVYQMVQAEQPAVAVVQEFLDLRLEEDQDGFTLKGLDAGLFRRLVEGVGANRVEVDNLVSAVLAENWPIERLERVLRCLFEVAAYEMAYLDETPAKVVISEYVALAEDFFEGQAPKLVNAALDRLARELRPEDFPALAEG